ncbi:DLW-39 family protein [Spongisporangium articulatum]|uniref:DLW-39 family protein n=1 Tax=Spongisporangium articulatum TaxID=3362603 RepID=A0ABW8AI47_9ACTN
MKKIILALIVAGVGFAVYQKLGAGKSGQELWSSATDKVR